MDHELKTLLDRLQAQLVSIEQRMATKTDLEGVEQRMAASLDALRRHMASELVSAVGRLEESIKSRKEDENALYRIAEDHERRIERLEL